MRLSREDTESILHPFADMPLPSPEAVRSTERFCEALGGAAGFVAGLAYSIDRTGLDNVAEVAQAAGTGLVAGLAGTLLIGASVKFSHFMERFEHR